jgi:peptidyl-prolyl cis-trans isomerase SurA
MRGIDQPRRVLIALLSASVPLAPLTATAAAQEIVIDTVVASVDDKPITLQDLGKRLRPARTLSLEQASTDPEARAALEMLILERVLEEEAQAKKVTVADAEVEQYVDEVSRRNNLSRSEFEEALRGEGKSLAEYREQVKTDILRSKLASTYVKSGVGVTEEEIDAYESEHPELFERGTKVKLRQILVAVREDRPEDEARALIHEAADLLRAGQNFEEVARRISEGTEAQEGGLLGVLSENDLAGEILDTVSTLRPGETSAVTRTSQGFHIFRVEDRIDDEDEESAKSRIREEIRKAIQAKKAEAKMATYFTTELFKLHTVDKKL